MIDLSGHAALTCVPSRRSSLHRYGGRWKVLQYFAARFYSPLLISAFLDANLTAGGVWVVNDDTAPQSGTVSISLVSWLGGVVATLPMQNFSVPAASSARILHFYIAELLTLAPSGQCPTQSACFIVYGQAAGSVAQRQRQPWASSVPEMTPAGPSFLLLGSVPPPMATLRDPRLAVTSVVALPDATSGRFQVRELMYAHDDITTWRVLSWRAQVNISASAPAVFVWLETPFSGVWSDNAFAVVPAQGRPTASVSVEWQAAGAPPSVAQLTETLRLWSLYDVWASRSIVISV